MVSKGRIPGCELRPYITHYGVHQPNLGYRVVCYTAAWIDLIVPYTLNLIGLIVASSNGRWLLQELYQYGYYPLAVAVALATVFDWTPRARRDTFGEGVERAWFYIAIWTVVPTQVINWAAWRLGKYMDLPPLPLAHVRLGRVPDFDRGVLRAGLRSEAAANPAALRGDRGGGGLIAGHGGEFMADLGIEASAVAFGPPRRTAHSAACAECFPTRVSLLHFCAFPTAHAPSLNARHPDRYERDVARC